MERRYFTLLEVMVALTILGIAATVVSWHIMKLVAYHRFQASGTSLYAALEEAQAIAIIHQTECELVIYADKGELKYQIKTDEPLLNLNTRPKALLGVQQVIQEGVSKEFEDRKQLLLVSSQQGQKLEWIIRSSGRIEPPSILAMHPSSENNESIKGLWIDLQTPLQIYLKSSKPLKKKEVLPAPVQRHIL